MDKVITLESLYEEGKLTRGDTLRHWDGSVHYFQYVDVDGAWVVANPHGNLSRWFIELPDGCQIVKVE